MGMEIERKFLVNKSAWKIAQQGESARICQGYLANDEHKVVRIRTYGNQAFITIKAHLAGISRAEYEYPIPLQDAEEMIDTLANKRIEKIRHRVNYKGKLWEVDVFAGENEGLLVAEIELEYENEAFEKPDWVGEEVTDDIRYYNASLIQNPYRNWNR